jgi:hypothetical protein
MAQDNVYKKIPLESGIYPGTSFPSYKSWFLTLF